MYYPEDVLSIHVSDISTQQLDEHGNVIVCSKGQIGNNSFYVKGNKVFFDGAIVEKYEFINNVCTVTSHFPGYYYTHVHFLTLKWESAIMLKEFLEHYASLL